MPILVTGANGNLGRALFVQASDPPRFRAAVRSQRAADQIAALPGSARPQTVQVDYADEPQMARAAEGCEAIVHLVGIIKEAVNTTYEVAHEASCEVLARAAASAGARRIVYMSIIGSRPDASNACLASKGRAERILLDSPVPTTVLRVPMVLGRGDYATAALGRQVRAKRVRVVDGGRTLQQPIDARDVVRALLAAAADTSDTNEALDLAGPECLPHRELLARAARAIGHEAPAVGSIPLGAARVFARVVDLLLANPPITPAMLGVLQHDDDVDPMPACRKLGIELTPLDETLAHVLGDDVAP